MNKQVKYNCKNFLIKSLSSSCLVAAFVVSSAFNFSAQAVKYTVPDGLNKEDTWNILEDLPRDSADSLTDQTFLTAVFEQVQNKAIYANPMLIYNLVATGQLIRNIYTSIISSSDLVTRQDYYDSEYSIPMWGENIEFSVKVAGSMPTENSWDILESASGENSMAGISLDGNSLAISLEADYSLNSDMSLGVSYTYVSSKRFGGKSSKETSDLSGAAQKIDFNSWKAVRAEMSHHVIALSGKMQLSDMMMGLSAWGTIGYGFGDQKSQRYVSVDYTGVINRNNVLVGKVDGGNITTLGLAPKADSLTPDISLETSTKITHSNIGSTIMYGILGASFSFPIMDNLRIIPSVEINYNSYSIDAYTEDDKETLPTIGSGSAGSFLAWMFAIAAEEIDFHQLSVMAKIPFDFQMDLTSGGLNMGFYPLVQMLILGDESVAYPIHHATKGDDDASSAEASIRMGSRSFSPGLGLYLHFAGTETWSVFADYELVVMDNDLNHTGRIVFTFSI